MPWPHSGSAPGTVQLVLVDAADGQVFLQAELPPEQLPETFAHSTQLHVGDDDWQVVSAEPATREAIVAQGRVVITLARVQMIDPQDLRFSLPTICGHLPPRVPMSGAGATLELRLDDWRQIEFVAASLAVEVATELAAVQAVYAERDDRSGFERLHARQSLANPLLGTVVPEADLRRQLGGEWGTRVQIEDDTGQPALLDAAAWFRLPSGLTGYALVVDGRVEALGLTVPRSPFECMAGRPPVIDVGEDRARLARFARDHRLLLVDWCAAQLVGLDASPGA